MYCNNCGKQNHDEAHYCKFCGNPLTISDEQTVNADSGNQLGYPSDQMDEFPASVTPDRTVNTAAAKGSPRIIGLVLGIAICAVLVTVLPVTGIAYVNLPGSDSSSGGKIEGSGFDSPEEAITGYMEALQTGNLDNILSTFAMESYCENYDFEKWIEQRGVYLWSDTWDEPVAYGKSELLREITLSNRQAVITQELYHQMLQFYGIFDEIVADGHYVTEESDIQRTIAALSNLSEELDFSILEIGDVIYGEMMCDEMYFRSLNTIKKYGDIISAEGFKSLAISFSFNGEYGILFMDTAKIDGKWYNIRPGGFVSFLTNVDVWHGGMIYGDDGYLIDALGRGGTSAGEALSEFYDYQDSVLSMYKSAIAEAAPSDISYEFGLEELNMSIDEMLEYFSMTELQNSDENETVTQSTIQQTDSVVEESVPDASLGESALNPSVNTEWSETSSTVRTLDASELPDGLTEFLLQFNFSYFEQEYDCNNLDGVFDVFAKRIAGHPSAVKLNLYSGGDVIESWDGGSDPLGRYGENVGYISISVEKYYWIAENVFNISRETANDMLNAATTADPNFYLYENEDGLPYICSVMSGVGGPDMYISYEDIRYDGEKYYIVYDYTSDSWSGSWESEGYVNKFYAEMEYRETDGIGYWSIYRHTKNILTLPEPTEKDAVDAFELFAGSYYFLSGAGAWSTNIEIYSDGTFTGIYEDYDLGDGGDGYDSTVYHSKFSGKFKNPQSINLYTYSFEIEDIQYENTPGTEEIIVNEESGHRMRWVYSEAYGIAGADTFYAYTADAPMAILPKGLISWIDHLRGDDRYQMRLAYKCLYGVEIECGWIGVQ